MNKGFTIVAEGQRINLRVYRRFFYPIKLDHEGEEFIVYSDTKLEQEINYNYPENYNLEDPFDKIRLIRLARALNCLICTDTETGTRECSVTICTNRELYEPDAEEIKYVPFDPRRLEPLEERIEKQRDKIKWSRRFPG